MKKKNLIKKNVLTFMLVLSLFVFFSCGNKKLMTLNAAGSDIATYEAAFKQHFNVQAFDVAQHGYNYVVPSSRYVVCVMNPNDTLNVSKIYDKGFVLRISDDGDKVFATFTYTVGAKESNPVIVNPNWISGQATMNQNITFTVKGEKGTSERATAIANIVYAKLLEFEGK